MIIKLIFSIIFLTIFSIGIVSAYEYNSLTSPLSFLKLSDTPKSYSGNANNCVVVNAGETGLSFGSCGVGGGGGNSSYNATYDTTTKDVNANRSNWFTNWTSIVFNAYDLRWFTPNNGITLDIANITNFLYNYNQTLPFSNWLSSFVYNYNQTSGATDIIRNGNNVFSGTLNVTTNITSPYFYGEAHDIADVWDYCGNISMLSSCVVTADGSNYSRTSYSLGYTYYGLTWGNNTGTDFKIPNLTNRDTVGAGATYTFGNSGGSSTATINITNMPSHSHTETDFIKSISFGLLTNVVTNSTATGKVYSSNTPTLNNVTFVNGSGTSFSIVNPYVACWKVTRIC